MLKYYYIGPWVGRYIKYNNKLKVSSYYEKYIQITIK